MNEVYNDEKKMEDAIRRYEPSNRTLWVYKSLKGTHTGKSSNDLTNLDSWWGRFEIPRTHLDLDQLERSRLRCNENCKS